MTAPDLTIVIPTLGRRPTLERVLDRLADQEASPESFEVVVVTDAREPDPRGTIDAIGRRPYAIRHLSAATSGASAARNSGWRAAKAAVILFIDDDILPGPRLVAEHLEWHRRHPAEEVGVLGHVRWARELRVTPFMRWLEHGIQFDYPNIEGTEAGWGRFYTANASVKRRLVERAGGFDERRLPFGYEDLDLGYRMSALGFRLLYNRRAEAEHLHRMDLEMWRRRVRRLARSEHRFGRIHPDVPPFFHTMFQGIEELPRASGRGARLARFIPRSVPWLGPRARAWADLYYRQQLAPDFMAAWEEAESEGGDGAAQPDLSERDAASSGGS